MSYHHGHSHSHSGKLPLPERERNSKSVPPDERHRHSHLHHPLARDDIENGCGSRRHSAEHRDLYPLTAVYGGRGHHLPAPSLPPPPHGIRGNPGPLGLLCFGMTTCMLMFITTGWAPPGFTPVVMAYALFYGGAGQLIAGMFELIRGSTFAGTAFSSYGCFWMGWSLWHYWEATGQVAKVAATSLTGDTLWCALWGFLTLFFFVVTLRKNNCLQVIFGSLFVTFFLIAGANYSETCKQAAGYIGFFCGSSAIYAAIAELYQIELGWTLPGLHPTKYI